MDLRIERLCKDIEEMLGFQPGLFFRICWKFISPLFIFFVVFFGLLNHEPLKYGDYNYPVWAECIGWAVSLASILMIPGLAILQIIKTPGSFRDRIAYSITPIEEHAKMRETKEVTRFKCKHWLYI